MFTRIIIGISLSTLFLISACKGEQENNQKESIRFISDTLSPDNITFPPYEDSIVYEILENIKICSSDSLLKDSLPPCEHRLYRVFKFNPKMEWREGFLVEIKAGIFSPTRQILCIYNTEGKYRVVNQYLGILLEIVTQPSGFSDILIAYYDSQVGNIAIKHMWENNHYIPKEVMEINNFFVKDEFKDSLYDVYIKDFVWGY